MAAEYTFFRLNVSGVVDTAEALRLPDDAAAIGHTQTMQHPGQVEVWTGKRKVATVPPVVDRRAKGTTPDDAKTPGD